ncbi:DUF3833 domain-containing protein [Psychromonas sp. RZ22]|uniref:DUF3833 domain-containing protein n=1 Tax=Psychromonas algarum TaxID=2555643 RepID=UPI001068625B|nr:DUF3833 domain-containing protein [Psychromonas sp. RZ22]TEW55264.1 DUF3833 domain-containing protein [Psychromonas sp. RZ22]
MANLKYKILCRTFVLAVAACFLVTSCSTQLSKYQDQTNNFDLKEYFNGDVIAWGTIQDSSDKVTRRFCVELTGVWTDNKGVLAEKFYFDDGEISYRTWLLTKNKDGTYIGTAEDVIGSAIGKHKGFAFQLQYTLLLPVDDTTYEVNMNDWMYQLDQYRVMNKTVISKFGINVANVTLFFDKQLPIQYCQVNKEEK